MGNYIIYSGLFLIKELWQRYREQNYLETDDDDDSGGGGDDDADLCVCTEEG